MLSDALSDEAAELLVASLFIQTSEHAAPGTAHVGFLRTLELLSSFDWAREAMVVNISGDLAPDAMATVSKHFRAHRSSLPAMFIATPFDLEHSLWTRQAPSKPQLSRMGGWQCVSLSKASPIRYLIPLPTPLQ